jgi:nanoRNase/pAp phosphatase (c-di-AMP/oligoRNAs hydrolase)
LLLAHSAAELLATPDLQERVERYQRLERAAATIYREHSRVDANVVVTDLRGLSDLPPANRFLIYTLPGMEAVNVSVRVSAVRGGEQVSIQAGHNIFERTCPVSIGPLMAEYGGGGHPGAGTCQVAAADADRVLGEIVARLRTPA